MNSLRYVAKRFVHNDTLKKFIHENSHIAGSTVFQGTLYEYTVMRELKNKLCMDKLRRSGGSYDHGIDIKAKWPLDRIYSVINDQIGLVKEVPSRVLVNNTIFKPLKHKLTEGKKFKPLDVLVQCKSFTSSKITGKEIRELMGAFAYNVTSAKRNHTVIIMSSPNFLTKDGLQMMNSLTIPLVYLRIEALKSHQGWYDLDYSGRLLNYYENEYASKLLDDCGVQQWLKLAAYKDRTPDKALPGAD